MPSTMPLDILLVDDSDADRLLTGFAFESLPYPVHVFEAASGEEALDRLNTPGVSLPHLILLDINMPRLNGLEVLQRLKADDRLRLIPVVMLTTSTSEADKQQAYFEQASSYLTKPVSTMDLERTFTGLVAFWRTARFALGPRPAERRPWEL